MRISSFHNMSSSFSGKGYSISVWKRSFSIWVFRVYSYNSNVKCCSRSFNIFYAHSFLDIGICSGWDW